MMPSECMCRFSGRFSGVAISETPASSAAILDILDAVDIALVDSQMSGVPGNVHIKNSTVQILRSNFNMNSGGTAGALLIESSRVLIDSSSFTNNTGASGGAIQVSLILFFFQTPASINLLLVFIKHFCHLSVFSRVWNAECAFSGNRCRGSRQWASPTAPSAETSMGTHREVPLLLIQGALCRWLLSIQPAYEIKDQMCIFSHRKRKRASF